MQTFESKGLRKMSSWPTSSFPSCWVHHSVCWVLGTVTAGTLVPSSALLLGSSHWRIVGSVRQSIRYHGSGLDGKTVRPWHSGGHCGQWHLISRCLCKLTATADSTQQSLKLVPAKCTVWRRADVTLYPGHLSQGEPVWSEQLVQHCQVARSREL